MPLRTASRYLAGSLLALLLGTAGASAIQSDALSVINFTLQRPAVRLDSTTKDHRLQSTWTDFCPIAYPSDSREIRTQVQEHMKDTTPARNRRGISIGAAAQPPYGVMRQGGSISRRHRRATADSGTHRQPSRRHPRKAVFRSAQERRAKGVRREAKAKSGAAPGRQEAV